MADTLRDTDAIADVDGFLHRASQLNTALLLG